MTEAEQGIIGCILIDNDSIHNVYDRLKPTMFLTEFCQDCYSEMLAMYDNGEAINTMSLSQRLESNKYDTTFIGERLTECLMSSPTSVMIKSYADTVIKDYKARETKSLFSRVSLQPKDIEDTIAETLVFLEALKDNKESSSKSMKQIVKECKDRYFNDHVGENLVKTGFYKLDDLLGGLEGGDVTVIGARPGCGKSAFVVQMIRQMAKKGYKVGYYNLEMNENQVYERMVTALGEFDLTRLRRAKSFLGGEQERFERANDELAGYNVIVSTGANSVGAIKAECRHQRFNVIIIDYLQLIETDRHYSNRASEVGNISKAIKALARELNVPIVLLSQLNRESQYRASSEPTMAELRESGDIEQDASNILLMWNLSDKYKEYKGLKIEKQRQGQLGRIGLKFEGQFMKFQERQEDFDKFVAHVKGREKGSDFEDVEDDDSPFD